MYFVIDNGSYKTGSNYLKGCLSFKKFLKLDKDDVDSNTFMGTSDTILNGVNFDSLYLRIVIKICDMPNVCKVILSDKYDLYDISIITRFNLQIKPYCNYIVNAGAKGYTHILEWLKKSELIVYDPVYYQDYALTLPTIYGHVNVLEWWKNSGFPLKYDPLVLNFYLKRFKNSEVLQWWQNSGLL
uniref:Ankyrin repeat protein n=1 Tax=viral metagenome TaxID=1070528 RepID=A0A6C0EB92_9ZZZZ